MRQRLQRIHTFKSPSWPLLLALLLVTSTQGQQAACPGNSTEAASLLEFQEALTAGDIFGNWTLGSTPWTGVVCDGSGQVVSLDLYVRGLVGTLRWEPLSRLTSLQRLQLSSNSLEGTLSSALSSSLRVLAVGNNRLSNSIPPDWSLPLELQLLDIQGNGLVGGIPPGLRLPPTLQELYLSANNLNGSIPQSLALPPSITLLALEGNTLAGTLPAYATLPNLQVRAEPQRGPGFCGQVPSSPRYLEALGPAWAPMGSLPACPGSSVPVPVQAPSLRPGGSSSGGAGPVTVSSPAPPQAPSPRAPVPAPAPRPAPVGISDEGDLLQQFKAGLSSSEGLTNWEKGTNHCKWTGVQCSPGGHVSALYLSALRLQGTVAWGSLAGLSQLQVLQLSYNKLSGPLGSILPPGLLQLEASGNRLSGPLPQNLTLPADLIKLALDWNQITGSISNRWLLPPSLMVLQLANNLLHGTIPSNWPSLEAPGASMFLFNNSLNGSLPDWPALNTLAMHVDPQIGSSFCGEVPDSPQYLTMDSLGRATPLDGSSLLPCPGRAPPSPPPPSPPAPPIFIPDSSSSSTGVIIGAAVGGVLGVATTAAAAWWLWRRRKLRALGTAQPKPAVSPGNGKDILTPDGAFCLDVGKHFPSTPASQSDGQEIPSMPQSDMGSTAKVVGSTGTGTSAGRNTTGGIVNPLASAAPPRLGSSGGDSAFRLGPCSLEVGTTPTFSGTTSAGSLPLMSKGSSGSVDPRSWSLNYSDLELIGSPIGEGSYARVYKARWRDVLVAVKVFQLKGAHEVEPGAAELTFSHPVLDALRKESHFLASLKHPNVVGFLGVCSSPPCLVQEYCQRGSLAQVLQRAAHTSDPQKALSWPRRLQLLLDAAKGMSYLHLHSPPVIHRDLKSPNLLVDLYWRCKVSDFNLSKMENGPASKSAQDITNPRWLAPEILGGLPSTMASDVFAFGVIMWEVLMLQLPWGDQTTWQIVSASTSGKRPEVPADPGQLPGGTFPAMDDYVQLMTRCWAQDPLERPAFPDIVARLRRGLMSLAAEVQAASNR